MILGNWNGYLLLPLQSVKKTQGCLIKVGILLGPLLANPLRVLLVLLVMLRHVRSKGVIGVRGAQ